MTTRYTQSLLAVFFCLSGWVCSDPALGAAAATGAAPGALTGAAKQETPAATGGAAVVRNAPPAEAPTAPAGDATTTPLPLFNAGDKAADTRGTDLQAQQVKMGTFGQIDLHVKDLELAKVLQLLSIQSSRNIIANRNVAGLVSADLYGVDFYEALDAILHPNGFGYKEKGNFIYVYSAKELAEKDAAERKTITKLVHLNYITAHDASTFLAPMLSKEGSIALSGKVAPGFQPSLTDGGGNESAHPDTLIVKDYPENVEQILATLKELDIRPKQVLVEATVLECKLNEANGWGVDLTVLADFKLSNFTNPAAAISNLLSGTTVGKEGAAISTGTTSSDLRDAATFKFGILSNDVAAFIHALDSVTDTTTLARPKLLVLNRQKAELLVGDRVAYLSSTTTDTATSTTVQFLDTGTKLTLRPFVSDDGFIRMELKPSISNATLRNIGGVNNSNTVPDESTEEITTNIMVKSGQTVILGGLFKEKTTVNRRQVPGLGDVPVVGAAFKGQDDSVVRSEVIFLVTPTVLKDETMYVAADRAKNSIEMAHIGAREELLPWSRSKLVACHLRDGLKAYQKGDKDKALWEANVALYLDPTSVEARRLKETLTGERVYWPSNSILKDAVDHAIDQNLKAGEADAPKTKADAEPAAPVAPPAPARLKPQAQAPANATIMPAADRPAPAEAPATDIVPPAPADADPADMPGPKPEATEPVPTRETPAVQDAPATQPAPAPAATEAPAPAPEPAEDMDDPQ